MLKKIFNLFHKLEKKLYPKFPLGNSSFSQCGEDLIVNYIFNLRGISLPSYLDIGANHPYFISNTALFHKKGCMLII